MNYFIHLEKFEDFFLSVLVVSNLSLMATNGHHWWPMVALAVEGKSPNAGIMKIDLVFKNNTFHKKYFGFWHSLPILIVKVAISDHHLFKTI